MKITYEELSEIIINTNDIKKDDLRVFNLLNQALSDWPSEIDDLDQFYKQIFNLLGGEITRINVLNKLKYFQSNISSCSWECESFTSLLEIFDNNKEKKLSEILENISSRLTK